MRNVFSVEFRACGSCHGDSERLQDCGQRESWQAFEREAQFILYDLVDHENAEYYAATNLEGKIEVTPRLADGTGLPGSHSKSGAHALRVSGNRSGANFEQAHSAIRQNPI